MIHAELSDDHDIHVGRKRVARLMRAAHLQGVWPHRFVITTVRDVAEKPAIDLVDRGFYADYPDRLWVADITYVPTWSGFLYLAAVLDVYSRKIVGWAMENHLRTELVLEALQNAITQRHPAGVIHHSDRGCQYTSYAFGKRCQEAGVMPSMGSVGDCYDNAMAESFWATLEREVLSRRRFKTQAEAKTAIFTWIEGWYNPHRRHSSLGYRSPMKLRAITALVPIGQQHELWTGINDQSCEVRGPQPPGVDGLSWLSWGITLGRYGGADENKKLRHGASTALRAADCAMVYGRLGSKDGKRG
jgi:putative transposase